MASNSEQESPLTDTERKLLQSAAREGYFKVPRETTLNDLADVHGLSDREVSERIRRGLDVLIRDTTLDE